MDNKSYAIDRFEGEYAVLIGEDLNRLDVLRENIPESAAEGDVVLFDGDTFVVDYGLTKSKKEEIKSRFDRLKKK